MKNFFHTIASLSFVIWMIGFFAYEVNGSFHYLLLVAVVAAVIRRWAFKKLQQRKSPRVQTVINVQN